MRGLVLSICLVAAIGSVAGVANAQPGLSTGLNTDGIDRARRIEEDQKRALDKPRKAGLAALQASDFALAEKNFETLLAKSPTTSDANYLMGLAKMGLKKWPEAKQYLEVAIAEEPKRPEPKARLAVAAIMVNDITMATAQRSELIDMKDKCNATCPEASLIAGNLAMVDKVIAAVNATPATPAG